MTEGGSISGPSPSPVDRQTLTNAEIEGALSTHCHVGTSYRFHWQDSSMPSPSFSEMPNEIVFEDVDDEEALNETQKKKKKVFSLLAEQYAASKCTVY